MSEESSSDEEWGLSYKRAHFPKCWECDKSFRHISDLMSHYTSHSLKATCHMCKITFRRKTSLSTHLDNVHSPPICQRCCLCFTNAMELNKHAETNCEGQSFQEAPSLTLETPCFSQQQSWVLNDVPLQTDTENPEEMEKSECFVEYSVGESDSSCEIEDSGDEVGTDDEYCRPKNGSVHSSNSYSPPSSKNVHGAAIVERPLVCDGCGKYFGLLEAHLLHCKAKTLYHCKLCKKPFRSEKCHSEHIRVFYTCQVCCQVFLSKIVYTSHTCPKDNNSPFIAMFCSEAMPKSCDICGTLFANEMALQNHITCVHASKINNGYILSYPIINSNSQGASGAAILITNNTKTPPSSVNPGIKRKRIDRSLILGPPAYAIAKSAPVSIPAMAYTVPTFVNRPGNVTFLQNMPSIVLPGVMQQKATNQPTIIMQNNAQSQPHMLQNTIILHNNPQNQPHVLQNPLLFLQSAAIPLFPIFSPIHLKPPALPGTQQEEDTCGPPDKQLQTCLLKTEKTALLPLIPRPAVLDTLENDSHEKAVLKCVNTNWRFKTCYPCRHCGAILRQFSLVISHRYLHRGHRSHLCQCGRAFKHKLHLLRHCLQHAEAAGYICVSCGETFIGSKQLARHLKGDYHRKRNEIEHSYCKPGQKCAMPFTCDCGQVFFRPSAFIWHQLKNMSKQ